MNQNNEIVISDEVKDIITDKNEKSPEVDTVPEFLEINVHDKVAGKSVGPGQK